MIEWFEIEDVNKGAARFDFAKLEALNGLYMRQSGDQGTLRHLPGDAAASAQWTGPARADGRGRPRAASCRDARPQGAREDTGRTGRQRSLSLRRSPARHGREGRPDSGRWRPRGRRRADPRTQGLRRPGRHSPTTYDPGFTSTASCESEITSSTATKASCSIAATRSTSSPSTATSSRPATCCSTATCRPRRRRRISTSASRATPWCTSR
jgi:hypothetical protein